MAEGHRRRVIDKVFRHGVDVLKEHEFLELCLFSVYKRRDANPIAHALLDRFGSLADLCAAPIEEIMSVDGVGRAAAEHIKLIPVISRGYSLNTTLKDKKKFDTIESIAERCVALLRGHTNEAFYILCFDSLMHIIKEVKIGEGSPGTVGIDFRKVAEAVVGTSTTRVAVCHNHPSGTLVPSDQDAMATHQLSEYLKKMGVEFIDHIIVSGDKYIICKSI